MYTCAMSSDSRTEPRDLRLTAAAMTRRQLLVGGALMSPSVLAVHAVVWGLGRLLGREKPWDWGGQIFSAVFVSYFALYLLRTWGRWLRARTPSSSSDAHE